MEDDILRFQPFSSAVTVDFWKELARKKLETYRLDDAAQPIVGWYAPTSTNDARIPSRLVVDEHSFLEDQVEGKLGKDYSRTSHQGCQMKGVLRNYNTLDEFKEADKATFLMDTTGDMWSKIYSGEAVQTPEILVPFILLSFVDLKKNTFLYWFCFPALNSPRPFRVQGAPEILPSVYRGTSIHQLHMGFQRLRQEHCRQGRGSPPFFILVTSQSAYRPAESDDFANEKEDEESSVRVLPLSAWEEKEDDTGLSAEERENTVFGFVDPCPLQQYPGWPLRNLLVLLSARWGLNKAKILAYRSPLLPIRPKPQSSPQQSSEDGDGSFVSVASVDMSKEHSLLFDVLLDGGPRAVLSAPLPPPPQGPVGWELNKKGKPGPRLVDLSTVLDPTKLMASAVDLNIKLMRWRALPQLDTETLSQIRCLLLGAGTLGCGVARSLLGWGVRKFEIVDNGRVSYSNPVRQSLFNFEHCQGGGRPKAEAACEALKAIFPGVEATAHNLTIPMPGHFLSTHGEVEAAERDFQVLEQLYECCDVIFVLTDTRESRWLPTLMAAARNKLLLNVSLGMDSYLVLRQGHGVLEDPKGNAGEDDPVTSRLGCYFCNDVVAPENSTRNRTIDQQCTVTRPGVAPVAAALAVELMVAILHAPERQRASAAVSSNISENVSKETRPLGIIPHQIRGFLTHFNSVLLESPAFGCCSACSVQVVRQFRTLGFGFVIQACNSPGYLEELTGLTDLQKGVEDIDIEWDDENEEEQFT